ncbi:MAG: hypothetical protein Kow00133_08730 [Amphiplicatus sp.]
MLRVGGLFSKSAASLLATGVMMTGLAFSASAATIPVANSDFEDPYELVNNGAQGQWSLGSAGWSHVGTAGVWDPYDAVIGEVYSVVPAEIGDRIGFVNNNASLYQYLGVSLEADTTYTLSALIGHRINFSFEGVMGFFAGDPSNIIASWNLTDPGEGLWSLQSGSLDAAVVAGLVGQQLGIFFKGVGKQFSLDKVLVEYFSENENVLVNPLPGAVWLFGSALAAGGFLTRRKRKLSN